MFQRQVNLPKIRSFFLFGARGTGKSTLLRNQFPPEICHTVNLLDLKTDARLSRNPEFFEREILALPESITHVVVDEIQKVPKLLDSVHNLIETHQSNKVFLLTGSSAKKLKAGGANLLAGRAALRNLYPLTHIELGESFDLLTHLSWGGLPLLWNVKQSSQDASAKRDFLEAYAQIYLKEEIWAEQFVRNLDGFRKFLEVSAQCNAKILNFSKIGRDVGVDSKTVQDWFQILEDTLLGFFLEPFHTSVRKSLKGAPKFYFFDTGVARALGNMLNIFPQEKTSYFREVFEQFLLCQLFFRNKYLQTDYKFYFLQTKSGLEIDVVIVRPGKNLALVEIKSTKEVTEEDFYTLRKFEKDFPTADFFVLSQDTTPQKFGNIRALEWRQGILEI
jgi:uncharacterized protein